MHTARLSLRFFLVPLALVALIAAGCGSDDDSSDADSASTAPTEQTAAEPPAPPPPPPAADDSGDSGDSADAPEVTGELGSKPEIATPTGEPPTELVVKDIIEGDGKAAKAGDTVSVQYVGTSWSTGEEFDASYDRGEPFQFQLGAGMVIPGWDEGIEGMKEGGRRELVIPPDLAYGPQGSPPAIGPNETLIFVVDLEQVS